MTKKSKFFPGLFVFISIIFSFSANAQNSAEGQLLNGTSPQNKVMIIPFNMFNYLSDSDPELAKHNKKQPEDISTLFRYGLNYNVRTRIIATDNYSILSDTTLDSQKDLQMIYSNIQYTYQKPMDAFEKDSAANKEIQQKDIFGNGGEPEIEKNGENSFGTVFKKKEVVEETEQKKYLNAVLKNPEMLSVLKEKYGTNLFLFINQFELITNYNHCLDIRANYFERKVVVHYSIYDASGKQLKGDAVTVTFSTGETSVDDIIAKNFPVISDYFN
ncbi:MAG: hypothetical protein H7Y00_04530, partial [Fimbriimonadaceae bacterium]|nr:hypothetical protein [Chitinophagales bacterium]